MSIIKQIPIEIKQISQHMKVIRFGSFLSKKDPWQKITGIFKLNKKVDIEHLLNQKGFDDGK